MWRTLERAASALVPTLGAFEVTGTGLRAETAFVADSREASQ
jgi:hypothetical protein